MLIVGEAPNYISTGESGLAEGRLQIDHYADTYLEVKQLARAFRAALSGERFIQGAIHFNGCFITSERDDFDAPKDSSVKLHRVMQDLTIWHSAAS